MSGIIKNEIKKKVINEKYLELENIYNSSEDIIVQTIIDYKQNGKVDDIKGFIKHKINDYNDSHDLFYKHDAESHIVISFLESDLASLLNFLNCANTAGVEIKDDFRTLIKSEWQIEKDLDAKFNTHPALQPHIYKQMLQLNRALGGANVDRLLYGLTNDKKSINHIDETDLLYFYAEEITSANGNKQEIDNIIKKIIAWFHRPVSYHADITNKHKVDKEEEWQIFLEAMHAILRAIPKNLVKQRDFIHKILIHKNHVIIREREQTGRVNNEIIDKMRHGRFPKKLEKQETVKKEIYHRHMQPVRDYEINYNNFLNSIDLSGGLDYDKLFKEMDAVEKGFSLAAINAVLEGRR